MSSSPTTLMVILVSAGLIPFALVMITSFVKMAVVLSIVRSAIGTPQIPPNSVVTGLALVLSIVVMTPVASEVGKNLLNVEQTLAEGNTKQVLLVVERAARPLHRFLKNHAHPERLEEFKDLLSEEDQNEGPSWRALVPAFVISQLQEAFQMGFVIFLPFLVLDMLIANILLSLGMHMLSPTTISLPFKLLLFVFADGWTMIGAKLVGAYI
jgi:type III secretion protein R